MRMLQQRPKRALVLGGGGARGAYEIGVWQALRELGMEFDIVTGTSVGALNGAMVAQDDFDAAKAIWREISIGDVLDLDMPEIDIHNRQDMMGLVATMAKKAVNEGGTGINNLHKTLEKYIDEERVRASSLEFAFVTVEYPSLHPHSLRPKDIPLGKLIDYLMASAACFPAFKAWEIDGKTFIDGGYYDNIPINLALEMGAEDVIAVDLRAVGLHPKLHKTHAKIRYIRPWRSLGNLVTFDRAFSERNMVWGYQDALKVLSDLEGEKFTFLPGEPDKMAQKHAPAFAATLRLLTKSGHASLDKVAESRLFGLLKEKRAYGETYGDLLLICAECAGEIFQVPELQTYRFDAFDQVLLQNYEEWLDRWQRLMPHFKPSLASFSEISHRLAILDKKALTAFLVWSLEQTEAKRISIADMQARALAFRREMAAAAYLYTIKQN